MKKQDATKEQLMNEMESLRTRVSELEESEGRLKGTERALRESEERFRLLYENAPLGYQSLDEKGHFLEVNQAWLDTLGYSREEVIGKWFGDFLAPGYQEHFKINFPKFKAAGEIHWVEFEMIRKDGSQISVAFDGQIGRDGQGRFRQTHCILHDISEIKRSQDALKISEEMYRSLVTAMAEGAVFRAADGRVTAVNLAAERIQGRTAEQMIDRTSDDPQWGAVYEDGTPFPGELHPSMVTLRTGEPQSDVVMGIHRPDGTLVWISINSQPLTSAGETRPYAVVTTFHDITERKQAEEAQHRLNRQIRALSGCNQSLIRAVDEQTLLDEICRIICDEAGYRLAWVGYVENDDAKTVRPVAWAGYDSGYVAKVKVSWSAATELGRGPGGIAVRSGEAVYVQDFATDPRTAPWRESGLQRGYRSSIALPLKDEFANVFGVIQMYSAEISPFTPEEIRLMEELASDLAFGIVTLRNRAERKQVVTALRTSEEKYRTLFEESFDNLFITSPEGKILDMNEKGVEMFGYDTKEEILSLDLERDVYAHPPDRKRILAMVNAQGTAEYEVVVKKRNGEEMITHCSLTGVKDKKGAITSYRGIMRDITDIAQVHLRLEKERSQLRTLVETIPDLVWLKDPNGIYLTCNPRFERFFGAKESDVVGKTDYDFVDADLADFFRDRDRKSMDAGKPSINEEWITFADDGHRELLETIKTPMYDSDGTLIGVLGIGRNITAAREAEAALRAASLYNRSLIEASLDPLLTISAEGKITDVNAATEKVTGYSRDELIGTDFADYFVDPPKAAEGYQKAFMDGSVKDYELEIRHRDGHLTPVMYNASVYYDSCGKVAGLFAAARDITKRKRAEESLRKSEERLELALQGADLGLWDWYVQTDEATANQRAAGMVGYSLDELKPSFAFWKSLVHPDDLQRVVQKVIDSLEGRTDYYEDEYQVRHKSGDWKWVLARGKVTERDLDGKALRATGTYLDITDKKLAESQASEANELRDKIVSESPMGIAVFRADGHCIEANDALAKIVGTGKEGILTQNFRNLSSWKDSGLLAEAEQVLAGGENYQQEIYITSTFGKSTWVNARMARFTSGGEPHLLLVFNDITERRTAEDALKFEREQLLSLFESINEVVLVIAPRTYEILYANKFTEDMYGKQLIGGTCYERLNGLDAPCAYCLNDKIVELQGKSCQWEYSNPILKRDFLATDRIVRWPDGRDVKFHIAVDITERKQAEEKNLWLAAIVESSDDAIIGKSTDGMITSWNRGAAKIYGYQDTEAVGKPISLLVPPIRQDEVSQFLERIKRGGHIEHYETVRQKKDGRQIDVSLSISPIRNAEGRVIGASTIARDITEHKSLQRQLLQAQKMEAVGTLAGGIAHDFNNVLQVVLGYSELVFADEDLPDRLRDDLEKILLAGRNGADLVQRLLTFSRKVEAKPIDLDLNQRIRQTQKFLQRTIPKMIDIELILTEDLARIHADPTQLDQVLMNLSVNARDAMPEGGKLVIETANIVIDEDYARSHVEAKPGTYVLLSVSDTGSGIDKETLDHIFEPFFTTKEAGKGTGLGLAMVYGIVHHHGGQISCYSEPGHGTTFKIYLPALVKESDRVETATRETMPRGGIETILLVDDEEFIRDLGKRILERAGYTVLAGANGKEALDVYKREGDKISLVILDLIMPEMAGKQCLEELLKIDPQVKALIASGFAVNGLTKEAIETGAKGFISKPYNVKQMLQAVRKVLDSE